MVHVLGFTGSALIVMSVTMSSMARLRIIGLAGGLTFVAYGAALGVWPVIVTNTITATIHIFHLRGLAVAKSVGAATEKSVGATTATSRDLPRRRTAPLAAWLRLIGGRREASA